MKPEAGDIVRIRPLLTRAEAAQAGTEASEDSFPAQYAGHLGIVKQIRTGDGDWTVGERVEDPLLVVQFLRLPVNSFWSEELEVVRKRVA